MWQYSSWASPALVNSAVPGPPLTPEPTNKNSELPPRAAQLGGHADDAMHLFAIGFRPHALERRRAAFVNHLRYVGNLAADDAAKRGADTAEKPMDWMLLPMTTPLGMSPLRRMQ